MHFFYGFLLILTFLAFLIYMHREKLFMDLYIASFKRLVPLDTTLPNHYLS